jgi:D-sedoheptulose 7-phosphate isomerase
MGVVAATTDVDYVRAYFSEAVEIVEQLDPGPIVSAIDILFEAWLKGRTVFVMGNGGSASTATHFACDLTKWTSLPGKRRFRVLCLNDNIPLVSALTNDEGWSAVYTEQLKAWLVPSDVVVAFSVHGGSGSGNAGAWSQNLPAALRLAKDGGARVVGFSGDGGGLMASIADACVVVPAPNRERLTPHTEGFHVVLHHLVCDRLRGRIAAT